MSALWVTFWVTILAAAISAIFMISWYIYQRKKEQKTLLLAFLSELILAFTRVLTYRELFFAGRRPYPAIYETTDATMIGRLANVLDDPNIISIIIKLKESYYQIDRYILAGSRIRESPKSSVISSISTSLSFIGAIEIALDFFDYEKMVKWTEKLLIFTKNKLKKKTHLINDLENEFNNSRYKWLKIKEINELKKDKLILEKELSELMKTKASNT